ncbi:MULTISPECIES: aldo/keto reductase [Staphylococcus]|jgi:2,5-diketo-D-gluconate reductase A|uniref:aldo/keto reductase n=1 Tax=Staphylococcus TaxID=1279 RepID=UPI0001A5CCFD|nr:MULTISPECIES: aldo/keto reductase [Staphylococcus]QAV30708.1 2,5-diketo-D-gluconic acid reductase [Sulfitobacter donghicola]AGZ25557.1 putative organophosphate reductase [Staphylococcus pasteuri SP1]EEQ79807.1 oxidoreductase, aldo/keto reductase family protein [Staphylococcus warneri L37603]KAB7644190.1 aldo/keto reductase [Staphylococcus sp. B2-b]MBN6853319.1 aldo/keto reductase [Staphylococcus warneri]
MKTIKLNETIEIPALGFGVFQIPQEQTKDAVVNAIQAGYRHIDTAQSYMNETEVGEGIKASGIDRSELFVTTKVWIENVNYEDTLKSIERSLERLQLDYIDLVLIHQPYNDVYGSWKALEELQENGKIKAIGVSNFGVDRVVDLGIHNKVQPQVNQIEINPFHQQEDEVQSLQKEGVLVEAWAPFAEGKNNLFSNETLQNIGDKYGKSIAQVVLRWLVERDIVVLAKSVNPERMKQNLDIFDFELTDEDKAQIATLDSNDSQFFSHADPEMIKALTSRRLDV